ncbi:hypothetical protein SHL15_8267 [Streptomyces hygroscopicus subsp. limoneus]|nr:hypothetical protein SHL15_8267 [Streptomyces hygroscopicus subsp. limoneus]
MTSIADELGSVFDAIRQPVWAVDADHSVRYANPAAAEALGHGRPSDLLGTEGRPAEVPGIDRGPADLPGTDGRPSTLLGTDGRPSDLLGTDGRPSDLLGTEGRPAEVPGIDRRPADSPGTDGRPSNLLSVDGRPSDLLGTEGRPAEVPGIDSGPADLPGTDGRPSTLLGTDGRPSDLLGTEGRPAEVPGIDRRPADSPGTDGRPSNLLSVDGRPSDLLGMDGRPADVPGTDRRPSGPPGTDRRPVDPPGTGGGPAIASGQPETAGRTGPASGRGTLTRVDGSLLPVEWTRVPLCRPGGDAVLYAFPPLAEPASRAGRGMPDDGPFPLLAHRQVERQHRHARTLQHTVQERLVRALLGLGLARQELGPAPARVIDLLHDVVRDTEAALAGVREVTDALSPGALRAGGLPAALAALAGRCPVPMTVSGSLSGRLPRLVESHLYLLVAEAVERAVENGGAARVRVTADLGASLVVTVVDDGAPPAGAADLAALAALTERAASLDGTLRVRHTPGAGTTVTAVVPL